MLMCQHRQTLMLGLLLSFIQVYSSVNNHISAFGCDYWLRQYKGVVTNTLVNFGVKIKRVFNFRMHLWCIKSEHVRLLDKSYLKKKRYCRLGKFTHVEIIIKITYLLLVHFHYIAIQIM